MRVSVKASVSGSRGGQEADRCGRVCRRGCGHLYGFLEDESAEGPRQSEAEENVEDVAADGVGDGHVALAVPRHEQRADGVGHGGAGSEHGDAHDGGVDAPEAAQLGGPRDEKVREDSDPGDGGEEGH